MDIDSVECDKNKKTMKVIMSSVHMAEAAMLRSHRRLFKHLNIIRSYIFGPGLNEADSLTYHIILCSLLESFKQKTQKIVIREPSGLSYTTIHEANMASKPEVIEMIMNTVHLAETAMTISTTEFLKFINIIREHIFNDGLIDEDSLRFHVMLCSLLERFQHETHIVVTRDCYGCYII